MARYETGLPCYSLGTGQAGVSRLADNKNPGREAGVLPE